MVETVHHCNSPSPSSFSLQDPSLCSSCHWRRPSPHLSLLKLCSVSPRYRVNSGLGSTAPLPSAQEGQHLLDPVAPASFILHYRTLLPTPTALPLLAPQDCLVYSLHFWSCLSPQKSFFSFWAWENRSHVIYPGSLPETDSPPTVTWTFRKQTLLSFHLFLAEDNSVSLFLVQALQVNPAARSPLAWEWEAGSVLNACSLPSHPPSTLLHAWEVGQRGCITGFFTLQLMGSLTNERHLQETQRMGGEWGLVLTPLASSLSGHHGVMPPSTFSHSFCQVALSIHLFPVTTFLCHPGPTVAMPLVIPAQAYLSLT